MTTKKITKLDSKKNNKNSKAVQENKKPSYRHFIDLSLLTEKEVKEILALASDIKKNQQKYLRLFLQPSPQEKEADWVFISSQKF